MNRVEIKKEAKEKIRHYLINVGEAYFVSFGIFFIIVFVIFYILKPYMTDSLKLLLEIILTIFILPMEIGLNKCILNVVRNNYYEYNIKDLFVPYKKIGTVIGTLLLSSLITLLGFIAIVPGIIFALSYSMVGYILADEDLSIIQTLKMSKQMMLGYKKDFFTFCLSFIGWIILSYFFSIVSIFVTPYMNMSIAIYYDRLKNKKEIESKKSYIDIDSI